jgi:hypothetical protein
MKSIILAGAFLLLAFTKSFAADVNVAPSVMRSFQTSFYNASDVQWTIVDNVYRADFTIDGEKTIAFFSMADGALVATSRYITVQDLSRTLQRSLKPHISSATVMEVFEVQGNESMDYYVTIRQGDKTTVLKSVSTQWEIYKK